MAVRTIRIEADIEGRQTLLQGSTKRKDGSQTINLYQRSDGSIINAFRIYSHSFRDENGDLVLETVIEDGNGTQVTSLKTYY